MEGGEGLTSPSYEPPQEPSHEPNEPWVADYLDELCPYYLSLGMTWDKFWHGDYTHCKFYERAQEIRNDRQNAMMLMQGVYVLRCFDSYAEVIHGKQKAKIKPYSLELIPLTDQQAVELKKRKEREKREKFMQYLLR